MNIIIIGAGQVGSALANTLQFEHNITLIDTDENKMQFLQNKMDIRTIVGSGSLPDVLSNAGADNAEMIIAVAKADETNIIACQVAHCLFKIPKKIARLRQHSYSKYPELFLDGNIPIDYIINPSHLVTEYLYNLVKYPGCFQVVDFADGEIQIVGLKVSENSILIGKNVLDFDLVNLSFSSTVTALYRSNSMKIITENTKFKYGDDVYVSCMKNNINNLISVFRAKEINIKKIMVVGAGNIGADFTRMLEKKYKVKLIERNLERCKVVAGKLKKTLVLHGLASDNDLLESEGVKDVDLFCSITNDDEDNIMSSMLAKKLGAKITLALVNSVGYVHLINDSQNIDKAISPHLITIGAILTHIRKGDIIKVSSMYGGQCEAFEVVIHGNEKSSKLVGKKIKDIKLPNSTFIGGIVKNGKSYIAKEDIVVDALDHLIIVVGNYRDIAKVEKYLQVSFIHF